MGIILRIGVDEKRIKTVGKMGIVEMGSHRLDVRSSFNISVYL